MLSRIIRHVKDRVPRGYRYGVRNLIKQKEQAEYAFEIARRSVLPLTDLDGLCADIPERMICPAEFDWWNNFYGHASVLKRYVGLPEFYPLKAGIQHGNYLDGSGYVTEYMVYPVALLWGDSNRDFLHNLGKKTHSIGAPFFYADSLLDDVAVRNEKDRLGKTLLAFSVHSGADNDLATDAEVFIKHLLDAKDRLGFDTVRVCMYFRDHVRGRSKPFQDAGFECVTAGHAHDPNFLRRLKSLLLCCDAVVSNDFGSHFGYAIGMDLPFLYVQQKVHTNESIQRILTGSLATLKAEFGDDLAGEFGDRLVVTEQQKQFCNHCWGASYVKTRKELLTIFHNAEETWLRG